MKKIFPVWLALLSFTITHKANAQQWLANEINEFKKQDSIAAPPENAILFVGSSSFKLWTDVQSDFPGHTIINRGFGGSTLPDVIYYTKDIVIPYHPKQVVIYCGDNDLAASDTVTAAMVAKRFQQLFYSIRKELPKATISYVSIKPSPSRMHLMDSMKKANSLIKKFLKKQKRASYIDVFTPMLAANQQPKPEIFLQDSLHMNKEGYHIWQKAIKPYLLK
ncbi:MAG TPA: SGNH/GDSL hydrolase family protein [Flavisolibacter sp.]|nr:SGNH/GDSL hydrolase family protein [Flavisolibacter sp.]